MPNVPTIMHQRLMGAMTRFYPSLCTILTLTLVRDSTGEPIPTPVPFLVDLACRLSPVSGREVVAPTEKYSVGQHMIELASYQPTITTTMRAVVGGVTYELLAPPEHDGNHFTTRLRVQVLK
jgi:hypothetical protein